MRPAPEATSTAAAAKIRHRLLARSGEPLVTPHIKHNDDDMDIAFAASAVEEDGAIRLYYSVADQYAVRATLART